MLNIEMTLFKTVAEEGSFSKAAAKLKSSHTAILKRINGLEKELGVRLFDRSNKGVLLTEAGKVFLEDAEVILQMTDVAVKRVQQACLAELSEKQ